MGELVPRAFAEALSSADDFREAWSQAVRGEASRSLPWGIRSNATYRKGHLTARRVLCAAQRNCEGLSAEEEECGRAAVQAFLPGSIGN